MLSSFSFSENTVGFMIEGSFNTETMEHLHTEIIEKMEQFGVINLYLEDANIQDFKLSAVLENISFKFKNEKKFNKIALVSDRKWLQICASFDNLILDASIKSFSVENRVKAMNWITEKKC